MELFFNLLWVALSAALIGLWLVDRAAGANESLGMSTRMQIAALAVLIVILLPVISLTDDLMACTTPTEVEHLVRRDLQDHPGGRVDTGAIAVAVLFSFDQGPGLPPLSRLSPSVEIGTPREEHLKIMGDRPPPCA